MASDYGANGVGRPASGSLSLAEQLKMKHTSEESHRPTVEDAVDEEDIIHPPPSSVMSFKPVDITPTPVLVPAHESVPRKAAGKQRAAEAPPASERLGKAAPLDTKSEELFPALGGGPKAKVPTPAVTAWGSKKPALVGNMTSNGVNGHGPMSSAASSRLSTPASGEMTPTSGTSIPAQARGGAPQYMSIPGRYTERVIFAPSQLLPRAQLKKPVQDILREINKKSKATVEMRPGPGGVVYFEGKGPVDAVRQALKDVAKDVGSKQAVRIPIPVSVRPHVMGRQGAVIQAISKRTGAKIQVPKAEEVAGSDEDDDSTTIDVSIEGDAVAAEMARREIEAIVNERTSTVKMRLRDIPAEFYPFIAGPYNAGVNALEEGRDLKIKVPEYHTWSHQPPPQAPATSQLPRFRAHPNSHIHISGDRHAVQMARAEIERQVEDLRRQITLSQLAINRGQHQFIVGEKGGSVHDLLQETGCAVILPPNYDDTEMLTITGPHDKIELGIEKVMNLATSMQMASIDIARQHPNAVIGAQAHARALTRYLQQRQAIEQLEELFDSRIVLPTVEDGPMSWEVYSRDGKNTIRARADIMNLINAHPPSRLRHVDVDPFFYQHLREHSVQRLRDDHGVHLVLPDKMDSNVPLVLVYEGHVPTHSYQLPRQRPSSPEIAAFERALEQAQGQIMTFINEQQEISSRTIEVPSKFVEKVRRFVRREQQNLSPGELSVQLTVSESTSQNGNNVSSKGSSPSAASNADVLLRGPSSGVESLARGIVAFVDAEKQDELERGYTLSFDFPKRYANYLIGKKGDNINKLRETFDVDIQVNDGKVEIKGPKAKAEIAKAEILGLSKKLEDEATHILKIKPQYHRELIGAKGNQVNRLQERYKVRVQFPRSAPTPNDDDSVADTTSEAGVPRYNRPNQAPDEVIIRGPRKGADDARDELLNLLQWTVDTSHTSVVSVAQGQLPSLIGQGGKEMERIRESTGAKIDVPGHRGVADASGRVEVKIKGTKKQVEDARKLLEDRARIFDETITRSLEVDKKYHKALIGGGGANIRNIVINAGGADDRRELARTVRFPRQESDDTSIRVEGNKALVEKIVASIEAFVRQRENQVVENFEVAPEKHRLLIGHGGETRRNLEVQFNVSVDIPKQTEQGPLRSTIKLAGSPESVEKAKSHILELVKDQEGQTVDVPRQYHHIVSDDGHLFRRLRSDQKVTVDHAGHQPPPKSAPRARSRVNGEGLLPLITDDQGLEKSFSWEVIDNSADNTHEGDIPWVLRGSPENVARASSILQKALEQAQQQKSTGYLILPDPKTYRYVVGQGGSQINSIRRQTGCKITVPRDQAKGEAIEILGSKDGVEQAKDIILDVVKSGGNNGSNGSRKE